MSPPSSAKLAMKTISLIHFGQRHNWSFFLKIQFPNTCVGFRRSMLPYLKKIQQWWPDSVLEGRYPTGISVQPVHDHLGSHFSSEKHFLPGKTEDLAGLGTPALHLEDGARSSEKCSSSG